MALLKAHAMVCDRDVMLKDQDVEIKKAAANGAKVTNLSTIMATGQFTEEQMVECRNAIFMLAMSNS